MDQNTNPDSNVAQELILDLENHYSDILSEYQRIKEYVQDWYEKELYGEGWKVFGLFDFPDGKPLQENIELCPITAKIVAKYNHGAAGFSVLRPHTRIQKHVGFQGPYLRCHLGLICPPGNVALNANGYICHWREGKAFVFDDRLEHEAWNNSDQDRAILLVDFIP